MRLLLQVAHPCAAVRGVPEEALCLRADQEFEAPGERGHQECALQLQVRFEGRDLADCEVRPLRVRGKALQPIAQVAQDRERGGAVHVQCGAPAVLVPDVQRDVLPARVAVGEGDKRALVDEGVHCDGQPRRDGAAHAQAG